MDKQDFAMLDVEIIICTYSSLYARDEHYKSRRKRSWEEIGKHVESHTLLHSKAPMVIQHAYKWCHRFYCFPFTQTKKAWACIHIQNCLQITSKMNIYAWKYAKNKASKWPEKHSAQMWMEAKAKEKHIKRSTDQASKRSLFANKHLILLTFSGLK